MIDVIYEDNHILVVIKPQGVPTQEDASKDKDMLTLAKEYLKEKYEKPGNVFVGLVHRLDRPTGGVMVFAKTSKAAARLSAQIKEGEFSKKYLTVCEGVFNETKGKMEHYLKKNEKTNTVTVVGAAVSDAKLCKLEYNVLEQVKAYSLVEVNLLTGRSHQIRVQFAHSGHPLIGDAKYNKNYEGKTKHLALWAYELKFEHPTTQQSMTYKVFPNWEVSPWKFFKEIK